MVIELLYAMAASNRHRAIKVNDSTYYIRRYWMPRAYSMLVESLLNSLTYISIFTADSISIALHSGYSVSTQTQN